MLSENLLTELPKLNRIEKLRVVQLLVNELASGEQTLSPDHEYEVWSPDDSADTARQLMELLERQQAGKTWQNRCVCRTPQSPMHEARPRCGPCCGWPFRTAV